MIPLTVMDTTRFNQLQHSRTFLILFSHRLYTYQCMIHDLCTNAEMHLEGSLLFKFVNSNTLVCTRSNTINKLYRGCVNVVPAHLTRSRFFGGEKRCTWDLVCCWCHRYILRTFLTDIRSLLMSGGDH